ncbi:unnamed protein product, partial [marine sediment metagenome]
GYLIKKTSPSIFFYEPRLEEKALEIKNLNLIKKNVVMGNRAILDDASTQKLTEKVSSSGVDNRILNGTRIAPIFPVAKNKS